MRTEWDYTRPRDGQEEAPLRCIPERAREPLGPGGGSCVTPPGTGTGACEGAVEAPEGFSMTNTLLPETRLN